ncbi:MAG TPA: IPT/TIG domain-containing protein, partial [Chryseosolibacter sp.]
MTRPYTLLHFLLVFCFIFTAISSWAQWTQVDTGLNGGQVGTLLVKDGYIFSGGTGVFRSADNGVTWEKKITGLTSIHVYVLAERNGKIYAGTNAGIFISSDNGDTWNQANPSLAQAFAIAFNGDVMFVGSQSGVHVSSDEGLTWELRSEGLNGYFVNALATKDGKVIAGTTGGVLISDDDGESWVASSVTSNVLALEVHNGHLFASVFPMAFYRSADDGENWTNISSTLGLAPFVNHIASSGTRLFISHNTDVKYSDDNGDTWTSTTEFTPYNVDAIVFDGANNIFAASYFHVYKSSNNGATWNTADNGRGLVSISDFLITGSTFIATSVGNGVFVSNDQGLTWESRNNGLIEKVVTSITEHEGILYVGTENAVFHSTDNALTWNRWAIGNSYVQQVAVHGDKILAATTSGVYILESGVWSSSNTGFTDLDVNDIVSVDEKVFAATQNGIYLSTDDGTTWSATAATLPFASANILQYIDESLWAATNTGVYYSKDDGVTWTKTGPDNPYVYSIERVGDLIFLGTTYGSIYVTRLNSTQYHSIDLDLTSLSIQAFIVNNNKVWMGTSAGLWSATVSEFTPPAITSFTPSFGRLGETVTITGADFDPVAANNIVRFGGVEAKIVSANASSITVIVPKEARAGQVTVTKNGLTATSASDFYVMAVADEWIDRNNGIAGGLIISMTSKDNQLFAASFDNGVYTSSDNGETWTSINQGLGHLQAFSVSPVGDALYAGTLSGVYVSTDNGASWSFKGLSSNGITSVVSIGSTLLASSYNAGVFASTDHGVSWQPANTGMTSYDVRKLLVFDGRVFAATGDGVFSSGNEGQSWVGHTPGRFIYNLMANDGVLYASAAGGIFISTDGSNWESLSSQLTAPITNTLVSNGTIIATDITGGIYRSSDSGLTWEPVVSKVSVGYSLLLASEKFLLGTVDQGIFESVDNGVTWVPVAVGPKASVTTILPDPINIFVGTHATVFTSGTSGQNWSRGGDGLKGRH